MIGCGAYPNKGQYIRLYLHKRFDDFFILGKAVEEWFDLCEIAKCSLGRLFSLNLVCGLVYVTDGRMLREVISRAVQKLEQEFFFRNFEGIGNQT